MTRFARALPALRERVEADLEREGMGRERVLACAVRLLDRGFFRVGGEAYTDSFGLATIRKDHVAIEDGQMVFDYPAKGGLRRVQAVIDPPVQDVVSALKRRRGGGPELLAYKERGRWHDLRSDDINDYIGDFSAKDFRTWNGTVIAAVALAVSDTATSQRRAIKRAIEETAHYLGNTPAVARSSYIDPRVLDAYRAGDVLDQAVLDLPAGDPRIERAVLDLVAQVSSG